MHELSLVGGIIRLVEDAAHRENFSRVTQLRLEVGALSGVDIAALRFACEASFTDPLLAGCQVEIEEPAAQAWCMACACTVPIKNRLDDCPLCQGQQLQATSGLELRVLDMLVE